MSTEQQGRGVCARPGKVPARMLPAGWPCVGPGLSPQLAFCSCLGPLNHLCMAHGVDWGLVGGAPGSPPGTLLAAEG